jgi:competence protein ComEC
VAVPAAVTLGAQLGVAPISLMVFGTLPLVSVPANLLAVPVAGFVMLYGLPAGLVAGASSHAMGGILAAVVQMPSAAGTRWVAVVAGLGARFEPEPLWAVVGWACLLLVLAIRLVSGRLVSGRLVSGRSR